MNVIIQQELQVALIEYLKKQPYDEVAALIQHLANAQASLPESVPFAEETAGEQTIRQDVIDEES